MTYTDNDIKDIIEPFTQNREFAKRVAEAMVKTKASVNDPVKRKLRRQIRDIIDLFPKTKEEREELLIQDKQDEITKQVILHRLHPVVEKTRKELLGQSGPFIIKKEANQWASDFMNGKLRVRMTKDDVSSLLEKQGEKPRMAALYARGGADKLDAETTKKLIYGRLKEISLLTGWDEGEAYLYITLGIAPDLPRYRLRILHNEEISIYKASLDIYTNDFSYEEIRDVFRILRTELNVKGRKALSKKQSELYIFAKNERQKKTPWVDIQRKWNKKHKAKKNQYNSPDSIRITYARIAERLGDPIVKRERKELVRQVIERKIKGGEK